MAEYKKNNFKSRDFKKQRRPFVQPAVPGREPEQQAARPAGAPLMPYEPPVIDIPEQKVVMTDSAQPEETKEVVFVKEQPEPTPVEIEVIGVRFKNSGKVYYFSPEGLAYSEGTFAIVETTRGLEYGEVAEANKKVPERQVIQPLRRALRKATPEDVAHRAENEAREREAYSHCVKLIEKHNLPMKLVEAEYTFDNTKLLFYFTSDMRVDFRDLVKDLASQFKTRIELRQIGIRDEAKMMGGLGICGRVFCCKSFLPDFVQVSMKMAKEQNLSLNSAKISGTCGRLMCCLRYEHEVYEEEIRLTPKVDSLVRTADGDGVVVEALPLAGKVKVRLSSSPDKTPKEYSRDDVKLIGYVKRDKPEKPENAKVNK